MSEFGCADISLRYQHGTGQFPQRPGPHWQSRQANILRLAALFLKLSAGMPVLTKAERDVRPESAVTGQNVPLQSEEPAPSARKYNLMRAVYIAAIALATLGWLWLIGWIALRLV